MDPNCMPYVQSFVYECLSLVTLQCEREHESINITKCVAISKGTVRIYCSMNELTFQAYEMLLCVNKHTHTICKQVSSNRYKTYYLRKCLFSEVYSFAYFPIWYGSSNDYCCLTLSQNNLGFTDNKKEIFPIDENFQNWERALWSLKRFCYYPAKYHSSTK